MKRKFFAMWMFVMAACLQTIAQSVPTFHLQQYSDLSIVNALSDNGQWAIVKGATTEQRKSGVIRLVNTVTKEETIVKGLFDGNDENALKGKYVVNDITDDGKYALGAYNGTFTDDGSYMGSKPGVFNVEKKTWTALPTPAGYATGSITAVTPDGKWAVGFCEDNAGNVMASNSKGVMWNLETKQVVTLENLPQMPKDYDVMQETYSGISADGRYIIIFGNQSICPTAFIYDRETKTSVKFGKEGNNRPAQFLMLEMSPVISSNGKYVAAAVRNTNDEVYVVRYDVETQSYLCFSALEEQDMYAGHVDNDGNVYASSPIGTPLREWKVMNDNIWYPFSLILKQRYNMDFSKATGFDNTGTMWAGSADGRVLAPMVSPSGESYIVRMPESMTEVCQTIDLLQDYTTTPAENAAFNSMEKVTMRFTQRIQVVGGAQSAILKDSKGATVRNSIGFAEMATDDHSLVITFRATTLNNGEKYSIVIPAGCLALASNSNKVNKEITLSYTGRANTPVQFVKVFPESGSELSRLDNTNIFPVLTFDTDIKIAEDAKAQLIEVAQDGTENVISELYVLAHSTDPKSIGLLPRTTQYLYLGAKYKVVLKPGSVTDVMGKAATGNEQIVLNYVGTYERQVSTDNATIYAEDFNNISMALANMMRYEGDHHQPTEEMAAMEFDADNQPWNFSLRETLESQDICAASHSMYNPAAQSDDWMVTPQLYIPDAFCTLSFDAQRYKARKSDKLKIVVWACDENINVLSKSIIDRMKTEGAISEIAPDYGETEDGLAGEWERYALDLAPYAGKNIYIGFWNNNDNQSMVFVDNILVMRNLKYLMSFSNKEVVVNQNAITISGKLTINDDIKTYSTVRLTLCNAEGQEVSTFTQTGSFKKADVVSFSFDNKLPLTVGDANEYSVKVEMDDYVDVKKNYVQNLTFEPVKRVVLEEVTGTTCPNCPRGILAIEHLEKIFGDRFIPLSYHTYTGDPYSTGLLEEYCQTLGLVAAPSAMIQRNGFISSPIGYDENYKEGFTNGIDLWQDIVSMEMDVPTYVDVKVPSVQLDEQTNQIVMNVEIQSALNMKNQYINIFPVAMEDGLVNTQANNLYSSSKAIFGEWGKGGIYAKPNNEGIIHNDVVRTYWGEITGSSVGFPQTIEAGQTYTKELRLSYPSNISEQQNGKICLMVMEGNAGLFLNAITVPFSRMTPVSDVVADANEAIQLSAEAGRVVATTNGAITLSLYTAGGQLLATTSGKGQVSLSANGYKGLVIAKATTAQGEKSIKVVF